jgi:hypothetical protein
MMLSVLRMPRRMRTAFIALILALFSAATGTFALGQSSHAHRRTSAAGPSHARTHAAARTSRHTSGTRTRRSSRTTVAARRSSLRRRPRVVRTSTTSAAYRRALSQRRSFFAAESARAATTEDEPAPSTPTSSLKPQPAAETAENDENAAESTNAEAAANHIADDAREHAAPVTASAPHSLRDMMSPNPRPTTASASVAAPMRNSTIIAMAPLRGSLESLIRQNDKTDADNLERIQDDADLHQRIASGLLVPVPVSSALSINANLPADRRYCRPWTAKFLSDLAHAHEAEFHHSFEVSSAVRTVAFQKQLMRINGNAAPAEGDVASPHLTGATIDIAKSGLSRNELYWMRDRLNALQNEGKIDVEEEFHQACFHITVYKSYVGAGPAHKPHHRIAPPAPSDADAPVPVEPPATGF